MTNGQAIDSYKDSDHRFAASNVTANLSGDYIEFSIRPDYFGPAGFVYTLADASGATSTAKVEISIQPVNDAPRHAELMAAFAREARAKVNLIEFNPTPELPYLPSPEERIQQYLRILRDGGVVGTVRRSRGREACAACGQLAFLERGDAKE